METSANESTNETFTFESVTVKEEPADDQIFVTEDPEDMKFFESCIDIEEHPVKLEMEEEETDTLICGLPAPDTEFSDQEQHEIEGPSKSTNNRKVKPNHTKEQITCGKCSQVFSSKRSLSQHQRTMHSQKLSCKICRVYFFAPSKLQIHQAIHANATKFECNSCHSKHVSAEALNRHKKFGCRGNKSKTQNTSETKFPCEKCFKFFHLRKNLIAHIRGVHSEKKYSCEFCGKSFTTNSDLKRHGFRHNPDQPRRVLTQLPSQCSICRKNYMTQLGLQLHIQSIHAGLKFTCNLCQKVFKYKSAIAEHMRRVHKIGDYNMFQCDFCKKDFNKKHNLVRHVINLHLGGKKFRIYSRREGIRDRNNTKIIITKKIKPKETSCDICNKNFKHHVNLYHHKRNVHMPKVDCDVCHRWYKNKQILAKHMKDKHS